MLFNNLVTYWLEFSKVFLLYFDNMNMQGLTIREIANILGISTHAVNIRLHKANIIPKEYAGRTNVYSEDVVEKIREVSKGGRPRKAKE